MRSVKSSNTKPELILRKALFAKGYRYFVNYKKLPGKPDIAFPRLSFAIFVNGCFWHRHNCSKATTPKTRIDFWNDKFTKNIIRDRRNYNLIDALGWKYLVVWECDIYNNLSLVTDQVIFELEKRRSTVSS